MWFISASLIPNPLSLSVLITLGSNVGLDGPTGPPGEKQEKKKKIMFNNFIFQILLFFFTQPTIKMELDFFIHGEVWTMPGLDRERTPGLGFFFFLIYILITHRLRVNSVFDSAVIRTSWILDQTRMGFRF